MSEKKNEVMEEVISGAIVRRFFQKLEANLAIDVAIVGAGPSGLVAAHDLAKAGLKVAMYESKLAPGGGTWGGGMLMNEVTVQNDAAEILHEFGIATVPYDDKYLYSTKLLCDQHQHPLCRHCMDERWNGNLLGDGIQESIR